MLILMFHFSAGNWRTTAAVSFQNTTTAECHHSYNYKQPKNVFCFFTHRNTIYTNVKYYTFEPNKTSVLNEIKRKKVLVAPLDWGLGHATRCIPVIRELLETNCEVLLAAEGEQAALLKHEFPEVTHLFLKGYHMRYSKNEKTFGLKMLLQLPRMQAAIHREHIWLKKIIHSHQPDAIISDNRYGLYHPEIPSAIMTHQLRISAPFPGKPEDWLQKVNYNLLKKFDECWIVDFEGGNNLAGKLSHPKTLPSMPVKYLGALSRFEIKDRNQSDIDLLILISGPEPQRTKFENLIRQQISGLSIPTLILCGKPGKVQEEILAPGIKLVSHLNATDLENALLKSKLVISRSGYTTVMDLIKLQKKAILIPTPGQTEQEYLAQYLKSKNRFLSFNQKTFNLSNALETAKKFPFHLLSLPTMDQYKKVVSAFISLPKG